jgi:hypothetical protein
MVLLMDVLDVSVEAWFRFAGAAYVIWTKAIKDSVDAACEAWMPAAGARATNAK